jgi:GH15 family glucan-1,4-alpha-glucosidase
VRPGVGARLDALSLRTGRVTDHPERTPTLASAASVSAYPPIDDYALIGDCRSAALVSRDGSIDWLCWPRFDSPSVFAALLDQTTGGNFQIRPVGEFRSERRYLPGTNVLETLFQTASGSLTLRDVMSVASEPEKQAALTAEHEILRAVEGLEGDVDLEVTYAPRPDYARQDVHLQRRGNLGIWCGAGPGALVLRSEVPLRISADGKSACGMIRIAAGERRFLSLIYSHSGPAVLPMLGAEAQHRLDQSIQWWQGWSGGCTYQGPEREAVIRSALVLKLMTYAPSGAVVAAPTTSLPEWPGGERNWDYRYCWLRDASFTLRALFDLGFRDEAHAYYGWLLYVTRLTWPELQVLYNVFGQTRLPERELSNLEGYGGARPVRIGNDARNQLQLDVYGEVLDAVARIAHEGRFDRDSVHFLNGLGRTVCDRWREPDEGIWEPRGGRFHHTHSKVMCWVALDRLIWLHEYHGLAIDEDRFRIERDAIRAEIESRGYNERIGSYTQVFGGDAVDASLLTLPLYGYVPASDPRMRSTLAAIQKRLGRNGLIYRYPFDIDDGLPRGEGAFGICGFWAVQCLAEAGALKEAASAFRQVVSYGNDLGLFAEEYEPDTGTALGNFPQAFTHIGLINAALALSGSRTDATKQVSTVKGTGSGSDVGLAATKDQRRQSTSGAET